MNRARESNATKRESRHDKSSTDTDQAEAGRRGQDPAAAGAIADAPERGKKALENALREIKEQVSETPPPTSSPRPSTEIHRLKRIGKAVDELLDRIGG
jgi:hypothetical protein